MPALSLLADTAADLMSPGVVSIDAAASVEQANAALAGGSAGAAVVIDAAGHPLGVVTKSDLIAHTRGAARPTADTPVRNVMTPAVFSVRRDTPAGSVVEQMLALNVHHLFVADAAGVPVGLIESLDVLRKLA